MSTTPFPIGDIVHHLPPRQPSVPRSREKPASPGTTSGPPPEARHCLHLRYPVLGSTSRKLVHPHSTHRLSRTRSHAHVAQQSGCSPRYGPPAPCLPRHVPRENDSSPRSITEHSYSQSLLAPARLVPRPLPTASHSLSPRGTTPAHPTGGQPAPLQL